MSDVVGELARVRDAFERPVLRLLDSKWAPLRVAVFKSAFSRDRRSVQADRLHTQVETFLDELRVAGIEVPPNSTGRSLCVQWMNDQWLYRTNDANGEEEYSLTSHALEALDIVQSMSRERGLISESSLNTILDAVRRCALDASPDAQARIERLTTQIRELEAERDRLAAGGEVTVISEDRMLDALDNLGRLLTQLPSDFKRVEESFLDMHRQILRDFRNEDRPVTEVLDDYLAKQDELVTTTPEGRAFDGAFTLLRDDALLLDLKENLQVILRHPAAAALQPAEIGEFRGAVTSIRQGTEDVLAQRRRLTATLREHIVNHDALKERELDRVLRGITRELGTWMETAGPHARVPLPLMPERVEVGHLRERFYDPQSEVPPLPLDDLSRVAPQPLTLEELRQQGGPSLQEMRDALSAAFTSGDFDSVGRLFNELPADLRRPVEVLGLLHVVSQVEALDRADDQEVLTTVRPNGQRRDFLFPKVALTEDEARALSVTGEDEAI